MRRIKPDPQARLSLTTEAGLSASTPSPQSAQLLKVRFGFEKEVVLCRCPSGFALAGGTVSISRFFRIALICAWNTSEYISANRFTPP